MNGFENIRHNTVEKKKEDRKDTDVARYTTTNDQDKVIVDTDLPLEEFETSISNL